MAVPTNFNRMINDLVHDRRGAKALLRDGGVAALAEQYELTADQQAALKEPNPAVLSAIGVAPIHQILLSVELNPQIGSHLSVDKYLVRYQKEVKGGEHG